MRQSCLPMSWISPLPIWTIIRRWSSWTWTGRCSIRTSSHSVPTSCLLWVWTILTSTSHSTTRIGTSSIIIGAEVPHWCLRWVFLCIRQAISPSSSPTVFRYVSWSRTVWTQSESWTCRLPAIRTTWLPVLSRLSATARMWCRHRKLCRLPVNAMR